MCKLLVLRDEQDPGTYTDKQIQPRDRDDPLHQPGVLGFTPFSHSLAISKTLLGSKLYADVLRGTKGLKKRPFNQLEFHLANFY